MQGTFCSLLLQQLSAKSSGWLITGPTRGGMWLACPPTCQRITTHVLLLHPSSHQSTVIKNKQKAQLAQKTLKLCMIIRPQNNNNKKKSNFHLFGSNLQPAGGMKECELGAHILPHKSPRPMINSYLMTTAIVCEGGAFFHYCLFPPLLGRDN